MAKWIVRESEVAGVNNFDINSWNGFLGPANMPDDVVTKLNATINEVVKDEQIRLKQADLGFDAFSGTQQEFAEFVKQQYGLWGDLIKAAGIEQK
ncbi:tripartite tricarboxylate transporter substrate-binding protein [Advenella sp. RU8]|uniref:tripartite tricarboxylate transporter substrate-binding protein n=1 Tax=Advenella sp. RU8 TaxID=3399575 RepID=UPI003AAEDF14